MSNCLIPLLDRLILFVYNNSYYDEEWKEIEGTKGIYFISNQGRLLSIYKSHHIIRQIDNNTKYSRVKLPIDGKYRNITIHRLVAQYFIGDCRGKVVHHKDLNPRNNHYRNLQILTEQEHIAIHAKRKKDVGENNG